MRPLAGSYKLGAVHHTDRFADVYDQTLGLDDVRSRAGNSALYGIVQHDLWREPGTVGDGLGAFARAGFAPADCNVFEQCYDAGLVYSGLWQSSARDHLALGFTWLGISPRVKDAQREAALSVQDYEAIAEATYQYQLTPWWTVQPDLQWIIHPGGSGARGDALVVGLRVAVTF